jgi:hypothetical protein
MPSSNNGTANVSRNWWGWPSFTSAIAPRFSSLSVARAIALERALVDYLNNLALRSFLALYRLVRISAGIRSFLLRDLPAAVRSIATPIAIVLFTLVLGTLSGFVLVNSDEGWYPVLMSPGMAQSRGPNSMREELLKVVLCGIALGTGGLEFTLPVIVLLAFAIRNSYFLFFEFALGRSHAWQAPVRLVRD